MNQLPLEKRTQIINLLVDGTSLRATSRIADVSIVTVSKLLCDVGYACQRFHDETVLNMKSKRVQCDEIWLFGYAKQKNVPEEKEDVAGDIWTWTALDSDSKLIVSWYVGDRTANSANIFMQEVAGRLSNRVQLTTDGHKTYLDAVEDAFVGQIDFATLVKIYGASEGNQNEKRYSTAECVGAEKRPILGNPDPKHISTSHVERQNLTMRMHMRHFTRLINAIPKKIEKHCHAIALHFVYYNFCKTHTTMRVTPAMEAGLTNNLMKISDIVQLTEKYGRKKST